MLNVTPRSVITSLLQSKIEAGLKLSTEEAAYDLAYNCQFLSQRECAQRWKWSQSKVSRVFSPWPARGQDFRSCIAPITTYLYLMYSPSEDLYKFGITSHSIGLRASAIQKSNIFGKDISLHLVAYNTYDTRQKAQDNETQLIRYCKNEEYVELGREWIHTIDSHIRGVFNIR